MVNAITRLGPKVPKNSIIAIVAVLLMVSVSLAQKAAAPPEMPTSSTPKKIDDYIQYWTAKLLGPTHGTQPVVVGAGKAEINLAEERKASIAAGQLVEPLRKDKQASFVARYSGRMASALLSKKALSSVRVSVRINAMIITSNLSSGQAIPMVIAGLKDKNPGVRYWAARSARPLAPFAGANPQSFKTLLKALADALAAESDSRVVMQIVGTIIAIASDPTIGTLNQRLNAIGTLGTWLNSRADVLATEPPKSLAGELMTIRSVLEATLAAPPINLYTNAEVEAQMARACVRLMKACVQILLDDDRRPAAKTVQLIEIWSLLSDCDKLLRLGIQIPPSKKPPKMLRTNPTVDLETILKIDNWLNAGKINWSTTVISLPKFKFKPGDLDLPKAKPAPAPDAPVPDSTDSTDTKDGAAADPAEDASTPKNP
jgi:hypothetical protein